MKHWRIKGKAERKTSVYSVAFVPALRLHRVYPLRRHVAPIIGISGADAFELVASNGVLGIMW